MATTSGQYTVFAGTVTRDTIITQALKNIGKLDPFDTPDPVDVADCALALNMLIKQRQGRADMSPGLKVWTRRRGHLFLSGTTGQYLVGPGAVGWTENYVQSSLSATALAGASSVQLIPTTGIFAGNTIGIETDGGTIQWTTIQSVSGNTVFLNALTAGRMGVGAQVIVYAVTAQQPVTIETAILRDADLNDVPMRIIRDVQTYDALPQKANPQNSSDPVAIYYENQLGNGLLFTDCGASNDVTKHLVLTYLEPIQDMNNPLDAPEFPVEFTLALVWLLSEQIAPQFFKVWTPAMEKLKNDAVGIAFRKDPELRSDFFMCGEDG